MRFVVSAAGTAMLLGGCSTMMAEEVAMDGRTATGSIAKARE